MKKLSDIITKVDFSYLEMKRELQEACDNYGFTFVKNSSYRIQADGLIDDKPVRILIRASLNNRQVSFASQLSYLANEGSTMWTEECDNVPRALCALERMLKLMF